MTRSSTQGHLLTGQEQSLGKLRALDGDPRVCGHCEQDGSSTGTASPRSSPEPRHQELVIPAGGMQELCGPCCLTGKLGHRQSVWGPPRECGTVTGLEGSSCCPPPLWSPEGFPLNLSANPFWDLSPHPYGVMGGWGDSPGLCAVSGSVLHRVWQCRCCCPRVCASPPVRCVTARQQGVPSLAHHIPWSPLFPAFA